MFQFQTACPARPMHLHLQLHAAAAQGNAYRRRTPLFAAEPGLIGRRLLAAVAALSVAAAIVTLPRQAPELLVPNEVASQSILLRALTTTAVRDQAEAMRASLLARPGVRSVDIEGLRQQRFTVAYSAKRLAALGISIADMKAALPMDPTASRPGEIALRTDAPLAGLQQVADMPVRAGKQIFRLGDIAGVLRAPLNPPASTMTLDGQPAARLVVVSAP
jgi:multidrug efflux pump subunit AcrB